MNLTIFFILELCDAYIVKQPQFIYVINRDYLISLIIIYQPEKLNN